MNYDILTIGDSAIDLYMQIDPHAVLTETTPATPAATNAIAQNGTSAPIAPTLTAPLPPRICFFHGTKIPVDKMDTAVAGNAVNVAMSCENLGLHTAVYTELGDDFNANRIIKELTEKNIDTSFCILNQNSPTNIHTVIIYGGERTIFSYHEKRNYKIQDWGTPKWLYYSSLGKGFEEFQKELVRYLKQNTQVGVAFNPGTIQLKTGLESFRNFLEVTDVLFLNKEEAAQLVGNYALEKTHIKLQQLGPKLTVITDGKNGASAHDGNGLTQLGIFDDGTPVVDKTGAGDAYASAFVSALFYKKSLREAMKWGAINSAGVVKEVGATKGLKTKKQILEVSKEFAL